MSVLILSSLFLSYRLPEQTQPLVHISQPSDLIFENVIIAIEIDPSCSLMLLLTSNTSFAEDIQSPSSVIFQPISTKPDLEGITVSTEPNVVSQGLRVRGHIRQNGRQNALGSNIVQVALQNSYGFGNIQSNGGTRETQSCVFIDSHGIHVEGIPTDLIFINGWRLSPIKGPSVSLKHCRGNDFETTHWCTSIQSNHDPQNLRVVGIGCSSEMKIWVQGVPHVPNRGPYSKSIPKELVLNLVANSPRTHLMVTTEVALGFSILVKEDAAVLRLILKRF